MPDYLDPDEIADWISEDITRGNGLIAESLYGIGVRPGRETVDMLINYVDDTYIDFKPSDPKFQEAVKEFLGKMPGTAEEWNRLIDASSQNDLLKTKLKEIVASDLGQEVPEFKDQPKSEDPRYVVVSSRTGRKIPCYELGVTNGRFPNRSNKVVYLAMSPPGRYKGVKRGDDRNKGGDYRRRPPSWILGKVKGKRGWPFYIQKYSKIITIKPGNIAAVYKDGQKIDLVDAITA